MTFIFIFVLFIFPQISLGGSSCYDLFKEDPSFMESQRKKFPPFEEAVKRVQNNGINDITITDKDIYQRVYKGLGLPTFPEKVYKEAWQGWDHFLGMESQNKDFPPFEEAVEIVQDSGIMTKSRYQKEYKGLGLPSLPYRVYKEAWQGWDHFLGMESQNKDFPPFEEAVEIVQDSGIMTKSRYQKEYKGLGLPARPYRVYKEAWQGWDHFLGKNTK